MYCNLNRKINCSLFNIKLYLAPALRLNCGLYSLKTTNLVHHYANRCCYGWNFQFVELVIQSKMLHILYILLSRNQENLLPEGLFSWSLTPKWCQQYREPNIPNRCSLGSTFIDNIFGRDPTCSMQPSAHLDSYVSLSKDQGKKLQRAIHLA